MEEILRRLLYEACSYIDDETIGGRDLLRRIKEATGEPYTSFEKHLQESREVVESWPEWKQKLIGSYLSDSNLSPHR